MRKSSLQNWGLLFSEIVAYATVKSNLWFGEIFVLAHKGEMKSVQHPRQRISPRSDFTPRSGISPVRKDGFR